MGKWDIPARRGMTDTELRFNPYHDPQNGRFTSGAGGYFTLGGYKPKSVYSNPQKYKKDVDRLYSTHSSGGYDDDTFDMVVNQHMAIKSRYETESEKSARTTGRFKTKNTVGIVRNKWKSDFKPLIGTQISFF